MKADANADHSIKKTLAVDVCRPEIRRPPAPLVVALPQSGRVRFFAGRGWTAEPLGNALHVSLAVDQREGYVADGQQFLAAEQAIFVLDLSGG